MQKGHQNKKKKRKKKKEKRKNTCKTQEQKETQTPQTGTSPQNLGTITPQQGHSFPCPVSNQNS
jgi:hypothetical protein